METIDIREKQIGVEEQKVVLHTLAVSVAKEGCKLLEIGSWCGESSVIIGKVAKEKNGRLFCIDWWKGNVGMELEQIAKSADIFSVFWENIEKEGLDDVVIPIRARSDMIPDILKEESFDFIYIDADHIYEVALNDIKMYTPLLKQGGIICGDDCEGYASDYDRHFLEEGIPVDCYESVHCGVVLAVSEYFPAYSINYNIWSVRKTFNGWEPTNLIYPGIKDKRQSLPPRIGLTKNYFSLIRYGKFVYVVPPTLPNFDVTEEKDRMHPEVITAETLKDAEKLIAGKSYPPMLLESYRYYNLIDYNDSIYAIAQSVGPIDLTGADDNILKEYWKTGKCVIASSVDEAKSLIAGKSYPPMLLESYRYYNLIDYNDSIYAIAQSVGPIDLTEADDNMLKEYRKNGKCVIANSVDEAKSLVDAIKKRP